MRVCVCVKAMRFDIPGPFATEHHTCTKDLPGKVNKLISTRRATFRSHHFFLLYCAAIASSSIARHNGVVRTVQ